MRDEETMICNDCGNEVEAHGSQLCRNCRDIRIKQIREELTMLES